VESRIFEYLLALECVIQNENRNHDVTV